jgi:hypothetical protein
MRYGPSTPPPMAAPAPPGPRTPVPMRVGAPPRPPHHPGYGRPPRARSGTRGPVLAAIGCSVAFLLVIIVVIVLAVASGSNDDPAPTYSPGAARTNTFTSSAPAITSDFQGTWRGTGYQTKPRVTHWSVQITLIEGLRTAIVRYPACSGLLRVVSSSVDELVLRQTITTGRDQCAVAGYVTLSSPGATSVRFQYAEAADAVSPNATGTLFKQ